MKTSDILSEGKITSEGLKKIEELIDQNQKLKDAFGYKTEYNPYCTTIYTKEEVISIKEYGRERLKDYENRLIRETKELEQEKDKFKKKIESMTIWDLWRARRGF